MLNNTIQKTIDIISSLIQKTSNLKTKADQNSLLTSQFEILNDKINILSGLLNSTQQQEPISNYRFKISNCADTAINGEYINVSDQYSEYTTIYSVYRNQNNMLFIEQGTRYVICDGIGINGTQYWYTQNKDGGIGNISTWSSMNGTGNSPILELNGFIINDAQPCDWLNGTWFIVDQNSSGSSREWQRIQKQIDPDDNQITTYRLIYDEAMGWAIYNHLSADTWGLWNNIYNFYITDTNLSQEQLFNQCKLK